MTRAWIGALALSLVARGALGYQEPGQERVDYTAYTLRGGELSLGIFKAELGVTSNVTLGTYVPTWFVFPFTGAPIPTGFVKASAPIEGPLALSFRLTAIYFSADALASELLEHEGTSASLWVLPAEAAASLRYSRRFSQSLGLTYALVRAGASEDSDSTIRGAAALSNLTLSTLLELRLSRVVAVTLLARALLYQSPAHVKAHFDEGSTRIDADLGIEPDYDTWIACAVPGVAFSWSHVNLELGLGYGSWWIPIVELPIPGAGLVPEANFYVRF